MCFYYVPSNQNHDTVDLRLFLCPDSDCDTSDSITVLKIENPISLPDLTSILLFVFLIFFFFQAKGKLYEVFNQVSAHLNLRETEYFGLALVRG